MQNESFSPHDGPETAPAEPETAKQKFERERLTRRQALKKFGLTSAMTAFALFSVDDLARMVGAAMERQTRNSKIVEQVAEEFQSAGIVFADTGYTPYGYGCFWYNCQNPSQCNAKYSWEFCPPCPNVSGCVQKSAAFNCSKSAGLNSCMSCCNAANISCQNAQSSGQASNYNCGTLFSGCQTSCGS